MILVKSSPSVNVSSLIWPSGSIKSLYICYRRVTDIGDRITQKRKMRMRCNLFSDHTHKIRGRRLQSKRVSVLLAMNCPFWASHTLHRPLISCSEKWSVWVIRCPSLFQLYEIILINSKDKFLYSNLDLFLRRWRHNLILTFALYSLKPDFCFYEILKIKFT